MSGEQHDDHCVMQFGEGGSVLRIRKVKGLTLIMSCECGCSVSRLTFPPDFNFARACNTAAMRLAAVAARQERGAIPVTTGSEARN